MNKKGTKKTKEVDIKKNSVNKTEEKKVEEYDDSWIYIVLLSSIVVLVESLKNFSFNILNSSITYSIFFLPIVFVLVNYIYKIYGTKTAMKAIVISDIVMFLFVFIIYFALGKNFLLSILAGEFIAYLVAQFINLEFNKKVIKKRDNILLLIGSYLLALIIFYMVYTIIYIKDMNFNTYLQSYLITLGIQVLVCIPLALFDKAIKQKRNVK